MRSLSWMLTFFISGTTIAGSITVECILHSLDLCENVLICLSVEWGNAGYQDIQNNSGGPDIACLIVLALHDLGSHVVRLNSVSLYSANECSHPFCSWSFDLIKHKGQAKVDELKRPICTVIEKQEVLRFEIAVSHLLRMAVVERKHHLTKDNASLLFREETFLDNLVEKLTSNTESKA